MYRVYSKHAQNFVPLPDPVGPAGAPVLTDDLIWIDLEHPTADEESGLERALGIELPTREEMKDIEPSSRLYHEDGAAYLTGALLANADSDTPELTNVGFVLHHGRLVTIRYAEPRAFRLFSAFAQRTKTVLPSGNATLIALLEAMVDRNAEILEGAGASTDEISRGIFRTAGRRSGRQLEEALTRIALRQDLTGKCRESLVSIGRMVSFLLAAPEFAQDAAARQQLESVGRDVSSLTDHASFLSTRISFLLDAALGLVNIEQNQIIKIFSVVAVIFLPPTLVASSYGMNFHHMPELQWPYGYPMALGLMVVSAILPYLWFKRQGWL
ncbi:MAG: magnesium/cobalt transporter CorA [Proteobacteria bacterium]|nr:magnesium/cobalt transporter CorA [Pseudomonadota bacterium]